MTTAAETVARAVAFGDMVEFYRVDAMRRMRFVLSRGAALMACGALVVGLSFLTRAGEGGRIAAAALGAAFVLSGSLSTIIGLHAVLREEAYIALRRDGLEIATADACAAIAWDELAAVRCDRRDGGERIVLVHRDGGERELSQAFAGTTRAALAKRLDEVRRKAQWNLL
jgi:hypothetical protein